MRLRWCAGSTEPSLAAHAIGTKISCAVLFSYFHKSNTLTVAVASGYMGHYLKENCLRLKLIYLSIVA